MTRPTFEVADILRAQGDRFLDRYRSSFDFQQLKAFRAILRCRTAALGGHLERCDQCGTPKAMGHGYCITCDEVIEEGGEISGDGVDDPGFTAGGSRSHRSRLSRFMVKMQPAKQSRLMRCVRFGPPGWVSGWSFTFGPWMAWHPMHAPFRNSFRPVAASDPCCGVTASACCWRTHASKSDGV